MRKSSFDLVDLSSETPARTSLEDAAFQLLCQYARMFASENNDLRRSGEEKLKEISAIWAEKKGASLIGLMLKEKQKEVLESKKNDYLHFLDD